jgi:hypothetical protein
MPIRDEPSFDPNQIGFPTGYLDDCIDVNTSGAYDGALIVYNSAVTGWIIGSGSQATGSLNSLSDVNVGNVQSGQVLGYLGPVYGWTGVNITGGSTSSTIIGLTGSYIPTGLVEGTGATNTQVIANWVNTYGYALIPTGEWYVGSKINVTKYQAKIFGPGTLKMRAGFSDTTILNLLATGCSVEQITLDGSLSSVVGVLGLNLAGAQCSARNVTITGICHHGINMAGAWTYTINCIA